MVDQPARGAKSKNELPQPRGPDSTEDKLNTGQVSAARSEDIMDDPPARGAKSKNEPPQPRGPDSTEDKLNTGQVSAARSEDISPTDIGNKRSEGKREIDSEKQLGNIMAPHEIDEQLDVIQQENDDVINLDSSNIVMKPTEITSECGAQTEGMISTRLQNQPPEIVTGAKSLRTLTKQTTTVVSEDSHKLFRSDKKQNTEKPDVTARLTTFNGSEVNNTKEENLTKQAHEFETVSVSTDNAGTEPTGFELDGIIEKIGTLSLGQTSQTDFKAALSQPVVCSTITNVPKAENAASHDMLTKRNNVNGKGQADDPVIAKTYIQDQTKAIQSNIEANQTFDKKRVPVDEKGPIFRHLKLNLEVMKKLPGVNITQFAEFIEISGRPSDISQAEKHLDYIQSSIICKEKSLRKPYIMLLEETHVQDFMFKVLDEHDIRCFWAVNSVERGTVHYYALCKDVIEKANQLIQENIKTLEVDSNVISELLKTFSGKCLQWEADKNKEFVTLVYTSDINQDIHRFIAHKTMQVFPKQQETNQHKHCRGSPDNISDVKDNLKLPVKPSASRIQQTETVNDSEAQFGNRKTYSSSLFTENEETGKKLKTNDTSEDAGHKTNANWDKMTGNCIYIEHCLQKFIMRQDLINKISFCLDVNILGNNGQIEVAGKNKENVEEALRQIRQIVDSSFVDYILQSEPVNEDSDEWKNIEKYGGQHVLISTRTICHGPMKDTTHFSVLGACVCIGHGCMSDLKQVDVMVIPVNTSWFPITPASELLFRKGGDKLIEDIKNLTTSHWGMHKSKPAIGHLQISRNVGNLECSFIFYIVVGECVKDDADLEPKLLSKLCHIFEEVHRNKQKSVAIPLELSRTFPVQTSSRLIAEAIRRPHGAGEVQVIDIRLCAENIKNFELAKDIFKNEGQIVEPDFVVVDIYGGTEDLENNVNVEIVTGSLVEQQVDAVVCINNEWDFKSGAVAKEILSKGGEEIGKDLKRHNKPAFGEIITVKGGTLLCKHVMFGTLPRLELGKTENYVQENLKLFLRNCYLSAKKNKCHSLAFPVLGAGKLNFPVLMVARELFRAAHFSAAENGVYEVKLVLLKDDPCLKDFTALGDRFQVMQKALGNAQNDCQYLDVKIGNCDTEIAVVQDVDHEALVSDIIIRTAQHQQGRKAFCFWKETPSKHTLNNYYVTMSLRPSPTYQDFKECLERVLQTLEKTRYMHITLDLSKGLDGGFHNYLEHTFDALKSKMSSLSNVDKITIVSDERMLTDTVNRHMAVVSPNSTFADKVTGKIMSFWSKPTLTVAVKKPKMTPLDMASKTWLTVLCADDPQLLQQTRKKIEDYCKKSVGSSLHEAQHDIKLIPSERQKDTARTPRYSSEVAQRPSSRERKSFAKEDAEIQGLNEGTIMPCVVSTAEPEKEDDSEDEVFGIVDAVLPLATKSDEHVEDFRNSLSTCEDEHLRIGRHGSQVRLTFSFCKRYDIQSTLLSLNEEDMLIAKTTGERLLNVIEDVDDSLNQLLLLYIKENEGEAKIRVENLKKEGNKLYVKAEPEVCNELRRCIKSLRGWNTETIGFTKEKYEKAVQVVEKLKREYPDVIFKILDNGIQIHGHSEKTGPAKHKLSIEIGLIKPTGRKKRHITEDYSSMRVKSSVEPAMNLQPHRSDSTPDSISRQYKILEGIVVKVYKGDITRLSVDCIVNAANGELKHGTGVAYAISKAAGPAFQAECDDLVQLYGRIPVTLCAKTSAGLLNYRCVIHAVGPRFTQDRSSTYDADLLTDTVANALKLAETEGMQSVAVPSISAGIFGGHINDCAAMYAKGVLKYCRQETKYSLKEVHFVDINEIYVQSIQSVFDLTFVLLQTTDRFKDNSETHNTN